jgi:hypothetical protein
MKIATIIVRVLLGLVFFVFGLNGFLEFIPVKQWPTGLAGQFVTVLMQSHYGLFVSGFQFIGGALLLIGLYIPLALAILGSAAQWRSSLPSFGFFCSGDIGNISPACSCRKLEAVIGVRWPVIRVSLESNERKPLSLNRLFLVPSGSRSCVLRHRQLWPGRRSVLSGGATTWRPPEAKQ